MFLKLTRCDNGITYINMNQVHSFKICSHDKSLTTLDLSFGTELVRETPDEIMDMMKGDMKNVVRETV